RRRRRGRYGWAVLECSGSPSLADRCATAGFASSAGCRPRAESALLAASSGTHFVRPSPRCFSVMGQCISSTARSLSDALDETRGLINSALDRYARFPDGCPPQLADAIRYCLLAPGKRLRPTLVLWAAEVCGCSVEKAMPAACAVEMVHTYSLVHDDLPAMD